MFDVPQRMDLPYEVVADSVIQHTEAPSSAESDKAPLPYIGEDNLAEDREKLSCRRSMKL